ncbi:hypothetical protein HRbin36_00836 [bacterium HR36]|nr:hypothetical protein HRbin36_00836 [bacterium HR36]
MREKELRIRPLICLGCALAALMLGSRIGLLRGQELEGSKEVLRAAENLVPFFTEEPGRDWTKHFTSTFLKAITAAQIDLDQIFRDFHGKHGRVREVRLIRMIKPYRGEVEYVFDKEMIVPALIEVEAQPPHRISTLYFRGAQREREDWETLKQEWQRLPGKVSLHCRRLDPQPEPVLDFQGEETLAVGSVFKLVVLSAVAEEIAAGRRHWEDVERVRKGWASLPAGLLHDWPDNAPVTWFTLAALMIGQSDNTAADHLIHLLGRQKIEQHQQRLGVKRPERNVPFLTTAELFKLKLVLDAEQQRAYVQADSAGRRQLLETAVQAASLDKPRPLGEPQLIDQVEWFFSAADVCRMLDGLRKQAAQVPEVKEILALNPGLPVNRRYWEYVGYKGGAEPGVLAYALLLRNRAGQWYALAVVWNNPQEAVDATQLHTLTLRTLRYVEHTHPLPPSR